MDYDQLTCGTLRQDADKHFRGPIRLIGRLSGRLDLAPLPQSDNGDAPNYEVFYAPKGDDAYNVGVAWLKQGKAVTEFLSLSIVHPDWPLPITLQAFPPDPRRTTEKDWRIVWSRPRGARVQEQEAA